MRRSRVLTVTITLWLLAQMGMMSVSTARAEPPNPAVDLSAGAISVIATAFAFPVRLVACVATVAIGGVAYGLTMGTSELVRQELVAGTNYTCGGKFAITPGEVKQFTKETRPRM
jgi:hypothetical protein